MLPRLDDVLSARLPRLAPAQNAGARAGDDDRADAFVGLDAVHRRDDLVRPSAR